MKADDQTGTAEPSLSPLQGSRQRLRRIARRVLWTVARPYARRRGREAEVVGALARLQAEFDHARERHEEQIERLEDLVRELILTTESLRRSTASQDRGGE